MKQIITILLLLVSSLSFSQVVVFQDDFSNNNNNWGPGAVDISSGALNMSYRPGINYAFNDSVFGPHLTSGNFEVALVVSAVSGPLQLFVDVENELGAASLSLFDFGTITSPGTYTQTLSVTDPAAFTDDTDFVIFMSLSAPPPANETISITSITVTKL